MKSTLLAFLLLATTFCSSQPNKHWDVANYRRLTFSPGVSLGTGCLTTTEGLASISDQSGNFLFSTNGINVYDRNCAVMPNGTGLFGGLSSTQSSIIVPLPNSANLYYIFTADQDGGTNGINYSIVDMALNSGFGAVTSKNIPLAPWQMSEKLCAVRHCNNRDVWVITKGWLVNTFTAYLLTPSGITSTVNSNVGHTPTATGAKLGQLKANTQGNRLAAAYYGIGLVEVYPFNNSTGAVSAPVLSNGIPNVYGVEFSTSGARLYACTNPGILYQFDLCNSFNRVTIINAGAFMGSLQNAPDGKMYIARGAGNQFYSCVNNPNALGAACGYINNAIATTASSNFGLPSFISSYLRPEPPAFTYANIGCNAVSFNYGTYADNCYTSYVFVGHWEWPLGTPRPSTIVFPGPGIYNVSCVMNFACYSDTITQPVVVNPWGLNPNISIN